MRIFNLPSKHGYQAPLALLGGALGATGAGMTALGATTALGGAAIGAGIGGMLGAATSKAPKISAPTNRSYLGEMQDALKSQGAIQNQLLDLEGKYTPQYQALQQQTLMGQMDTLGNLYNYSNPLTQKLQTEYAGMQLPLYGAIGQGANQAYQSGLGEQTMGLYNTMQRQAKEGLDAGYGLTPEMQRQAQQSARAAMSARGLAGGNQGIAQEVLNSYALGNQRYQQSLGNAQQAYGLGVNQFGGAMQTYGQPLMQQIQAYSPTAMYGQAVTGSQMLGAKLFQPESQYNAGVYGANQSNQMQTSMANAQIAASQQAAQMGMLGSLGGSALGGMAYTGTGLFRP